MAVLLVLLLSPLISVKANGETIGTPEQPSEAITIRQATAEASSTFNAAEAIDTVTKDAVFGTATNQLQWSLANFGYDWQLDNGAPRITDVELFFLLSNQTGPVGWLVATVTPNLENLLSLSSEGAVYHYTVNFNYSWAGYEFYNSKIPGKTPIYESTQSWTIPSVSQPWSGACSSFVCDYSVWAGLTDQEGGGTSGQSGYGIVQAGFDSCIGSTYWVGLACNGQSFDGWFEVFPAITQFPINFNANSGDSVYSDVYSYGAQGSNYWDYSIVMLDYTANTGYSTDTSFGNFSKTDMGVPYYADAMTEQIGSPLPQFNRVNITSDVLVNGTSESVYNLFQSPYQYYILNEELNSTGSVAVGTTVVYSSGIFSTVWLTSQGT
jgi:hypothetical protein